MLGQVSITGKHVGLIGVLLDVIGGSANCRPVGARILCHVSEAPVAAVLGSVDEYRIGVDQ